MRKEGLFQETSFQPRSSASIKIMLGDLEITTVNTIYLHYNVFPKSIIHYDIMYEILGGGGGVHTSDDICQYPVEESGGGHYRTI